MRRTLAPARDLVDRAHSEAAEAAERAGVQVVLLDDLDAIHQASSLFAEIWGTSHEDVQVPPELLRALTHAGNYAAGAVSDGEVVGAVVGFLGREGHETYLHSHILGVAPGRRGSNVGFALKLHQRAWALAAGLGKVTWTFDPLVRRNAYFNVQKLGARPALYLESFYGPMRDAVNAGDETDRLLVVWDLDDERAARAASGRLDEPSEPEAPDAIALSAQDGERPRTGHVRGEVAFCSTPDDILALRRTDPSNASRWRIALRSTLGAALQDGYTVSGFTRSGWYVLNRDGAVT